MKYREHLEQLAKEDVAKVQQKINTCMDSIRELKTELEDTALETEERLKKGLSATDHRICSEYLRSLKIKLNSERVVLEKLKAILAGKQEVLKRKSISKKILVNLKDKQKKTYYHEIEKEMMKEADEMVLIRRFFDENI